MDDQEAQNRKWLTAKIIATLSKYALDIVMILALGTMGCVGTQTYRDALDQMEPLIESGALPECVRNLPMGLAMVMLAGIIALFWMRRRRL